MTAAFGDFLDLAAGSLSETASVRDLPSSTVVATATRLRRLVTALSRYVADPRTPRQPRSACACTRPLPACAGPPRPAPD